MIFYPEEGKKWSILGWCHLWTVGPVQLINNKQKSIIHLFLTSAFETLNPASLLLTLNSYHSSNKCEKTIRSEKKM